MFCGNSVYAEIYVMSRIVNSMAEDGLIFKFLSIIFERYKTPVTATISSGVFAAVISLLFDLEKLVDLMALLGLIGYCLVSLCVIILRLFLHEIFILCNLIKNNFFNIY